MKNKQVLTRKQESDKRIKNFDEVDLGYTGEEAKKEAERCLQCKNPKCMEGCPVGIDIPRFIRYIKEGKNYMALKTIKRTNNLPGICGRVCPQEQQCEKGCIMGIKEEPINIGKLERFAADSEEPSFKAPEISRGKKKVAVVGSGPAGLTCASDLAVKGHKAVIFEALHESGGVLKYGIPGFRLPKDIVDKEIGYIESLGVEIKKNSVIGRLFGLDELRKKYDAVFIGAGAGLPKFMGIEGENLANVYSANEFLTRINLMKAYLFPEYLTPLKKGKKVVVIGGGNVAMDSARCARRMGSDVTVLYRRSLDEMPARKEEIEHAQGEGIHFMLLTNPVRILGEKKVEGIVCIQMMLGEPDDSGRRKPIPLEGSEFTLECDQVIDAIGQGPNPVLTRTINIAHNEKGYIIVDENMMTSMPGVFAGGDITGGEEGSGATVINAMGAGKKAAKAIDKWIKQEKLIQE
ncbi:NADPH-dependent glutamate synthase [Candidatus Woesearchaeota archaeon]|nr:NADPH-dependent glutamate synthase [Candidatus Woesearchaeota archaeon]